VQLLEVNLCDDLRYYLSQLNDEVKKHSWRNGRSSPRNKNTRFTGL